MIFYRPTDGDVQGGPIAWSPRSCFVMSAMGTPVPPTLARARKRVNAMLAASSFTVRDATSVTTGKDYLLKIWSLLVCSPVGVAVVHEGVRPDTMANIYYELGLMQAYGRETVVVRIGEVRLPSDLARTEYIQFDGSFTRRFTAFLSSLDERAEYYLVLANQLEKDPLLAMDYLRRSYLLTGDLSLRSRVKAIFDDAGFSNRPLRSVEHNLAQL